MAIKKRAYQKSRKLILYGSSSLAVLIAFLFGMSAYGVTPEISDKTIKCFGYNINDPSNTSTDCVDYFNITLDPWHLCFNKDFELYLNDTEGVNLIVYKADQRYRSDNPNRWKLYSFDTCLKNATKHEFKVELRTLDNKPLNREIKWGLKYGFTDVDPAFSSVTVNDVFPTLIENKADLSYGTATFNISNPTLFDVPISSKLFNIWIEEFKGNPVYNVSVFYLADITKTNAVPTFTTVCNPYDNIIANGTEHYDNCTQAFAGYKNETVKYTDFVPFNLTTFKAKSDLTIKITARWKPQTGLISKDWKPSINMSGLVYKQDKWAWFNTSFTNCANWTIVNNMVSTQMHGFYFFNFTSLTSKQVDSDDVRIVNAGCNAGGSDIRYNVYTNTSTSTYALVELDLSAGANTNYSVYWNNPSATKPSYPSIDLGFVDVTNDQRNFSNQYWNMIVANGTTAGITIIDTQTYLKAYSNSTFLGGVDTSSSTETWTGCSGRISFNDTLMKEFTATCNEGVGIHRFFDNYTFWNTNINITIGGTANTLALGGWKPNGSVNVVTAYIDDSGVVNLQQPASVPWTTGGTNISDGWFVGYMTGDVGGGGGGTSDSVWGVAWNQSNAFATDAGKTWLYDNQDSSGRYLGINGRGGAGNTMKNFSAWYGIYMPRTGEKPWTQTEIINNITEYPPTFIQGSTEVLPSATMTRITLDSLNANRSYELGTNVTIYANFTDSTGALVTSDSFCLDIDQNGYGTNFTCSTTGEIRYNYTLNASAKNVFANGSKTIILNFTSTDACYQETANKSTSCGGLDTGSYEIVLPPFGVWSTNASLIDENWSSFAYDDGASNPYLYINYSKPTTRNILSSSFWQIKGGTLGAMNVSIPQSCWNWNNNILRFRVNTYSLETTDRHSFECFDGTWNVLHSESGGIGGNIQNVYEEAMWWNLTNLKSINVTLHSFDEPINMTFDISNTNQPNPTGIGNLDVEISFGNTIINKFYGRWAGDFVNLTFMNNSVTETNLSFSSASNKVVYAQLPNRTINSSSLSLSGSSFYSNVTIGASNLTIENQSSYSMCGTYTLDRFVVINSTISVCLYNGTTLNGLNTTGYINITANLISIDVNSTINATARGYNGSLTGGGGSGSGGGTGANGGTGTGAGTRGYDDSGTAGGGGGGASGYVTVGNGGGSGGADGRGYQPGGGGDGGITYGQSNIDLFAITMLGSGAAGGGGGGGGSNADGGVGNGGDRGGGIIRLKAANITIKGNITAVGGVGGAGGGGGSCTIVNGYGGGGGGGGGGGSGGVIVINGGNVTINGVINITGGLGGSGGGGGSASGSCTRPGLSGTSGGSGSKGRLSVFFVSFSNTSMSLDTGSNYQAKTGFPINVSLDFNFDGTKDFTYIGEMRPENGTINVTITPNIITSYLNVSCRYTAEKICNYPIVVSTASSGAVQVSNVNFLYNASPITVNKGLIESALNSSSFGYTTFSINVSSISYSGLPAPLFRISNLNLYYRGSDEVNITSHFDGNTTHNPSNYTLKANIYYSGYNYTFPKNIKYLEFTPSSPTSVNVSAFGQAGQVPIFNITTRNYGKPANFSMRINETALCVNLTASNTSSTSNSNILTTTFQNFYINRSVNSNFGIWMWANYNCSLSSWSLFNSDVIFRQCCEGCICHAGD